MKTTGNNIPFTGSDYEQYENTGYYYIDCYAVASLVFDTDSFECEDDCSEEDKDYFYLEMYKAKSEFEYNVKMAS